MIKHIFIETQAFNWAVPSEFRNISPASGHFALVTGLNSVTSQSWTVLLFSGSKMEGLGLLLLKLGLKQSWFVSCHPSPSLLFDLQFLYTIVNVWIY